MISIFSDEVVQKRKYNPNIPLMNTGINNKDISGLSDDILFE